MDENISCIHVWFAGGWDALKGVAIHDNIFFLACPKLINLLNIGDAQLDFEGNTYVQGRYQRALTYAKTYDAQFEYGAADETAFAAAVRDVLGDSTAKVHTITLGLENAETDRASALGLVPDGAPEDLHAQITEAEFVKILTALIEYASPDKLESWEAVSKVAAASDFPLTRADGMIALYEAAMALGWHLPTSGLAWQNFDRMNAAEGDAWVEIDAADWDLFPNTQETGVDPENPDLRLYHLAMLYALGRYASASSAYLFDDDGQNDTLRGREPLTWETALKAAVRLIDCENPNADQDYLVRLG